MWSLPIRDQVNDRPLTPKNAALILIDYQPPQVSQRRSRWRRLCQGKTVADSRSAVPERYCSEDKIIDSDSLLRARIENH